MISSALKRGYKAWRVYDTSLIVLNKYYSCKVRVETSPAQLVKVFGPPSFWDKMEGTTGYYDFEDEYLDLFKLADKYECKETINFSQLKRGDKGPYHLRGKTGPFPTIDEFWKSNTKYKFWLYANQYADSKSMAEWINNKLAEDVDIKKKVEDLYGPIENFKNYDKDYELDKEYAIFKYNRLNWEK
ncbi:unnamed protein product [Blepharisma stoltei]|uniref:Uncharacterized protein n=1 Tax=Blepharisma stoltei TaxID=1481888 RepID=A0AAU9IXV0_9CILI|nr:unnamed protein product [Blepharisma stoltei]